MDDCVLLALTDLYWLRSDFASDNLTGTPPPLPLGADVFLPLSAYFSSVRETEARVEESFEPATEILPEEPPLSPELIDMPEGCDDFLPQAATGDMTLDESGFFVKVRGMKRSSDFLADSFVISFSTTFRERAPRAAILA